MERAVQRPSIYKKILAPVVVAGLGLFGVASSEQSAQAGDDTKVEAGGVLELDLGVPNSAITGNVTVTQTEAPGHVTMYPCNEGRPTTSNLNWTGPNQTVANGFNVPTDSAGKLCAFTLSRTHLVVDISGEADEATTEGLGMHKPTRAEDTRTAPGRVGKVEAGGVLELDLGVPNSAITGNVTVTQTEAPGHVTMYPCNEGRPTTSNLNWTGPNQTVANGFNVPTDSAGKLCAFTLSRTHLVVDISGEADEATTEGLGMHKPTRAEDTRTAPGRVGKVEAGGVLELDLGVPNSAITGNVTVTQTEAPGHVTMYPCNEGRPTTSNLNWTGPNQTVANGFNVPTDSAGKLCAFTLSRTHLVVDISGEADEATTEGLGMHKPTRARDTRLDESVDPPPTGEVVVTQECNAGAPGDGVQTNIVRVEMPENPNGYYITGEQAYDGELLDGAYVIAAYEDGTTEQKSLEAWETSPGNVVGLATISKSMGDRDWPDGSSTQPDVIGFEARGTFKNGSPFIRVITGLDYQHCRIVNPDEAKQQVFKRIY